MECKLAPQVGDLFDSKYLYEYSSRFDDKVSLGHCLLVVKYTVKTADGLLTEEAGGVIRAVVEVSRGPKPLLLQSLADGIDLLPLNIATRVRLLNDDYDPRNQDSRVTLYETAVDAINSILASEDSRNKRFVTRIATILREADDFHLIPRLSEPNVTLKEIRAQLDELVECTRCGSIDGKAVRSLLRSEPSEVNHSLVPKGELLKVKTIAGLLMDTQSQRGFQTFGEIEWVGSAGPRQWRLELAERATNVLAHFSQLWSTPRHYGDHVRAMEQLKERCHHGDRAAESAANAHLATLLCELDWVSDVAHHVLGHDHHAEYQSVREEFVQKLANEPDVQLSYQSLGISSKERPRIEYLLPGEPGSVVETLSRNITMPEWTHPRDNLVVVGLGFESRVPKAWRQVQDLYTQIRLVTHQLAFHDLERLFELRDAYIKCGSPVALLPLIQFAEMSCSKLKEQDEGEEFRNAVTAVERIVETELKLRRVRLPRWRPMPSGGKSDYYRIQPVTIEGRSSDLVVRILRPAYENLEDGTISVGLVQVTN
jgi:hypothetical protein